MTKDHTSDAYDTIETIKITARDTAQTLKSEVASSAQHLRAQASEAAADYAQAAQQRVAAETGAVSDGIHQVASDLPEGSPQQQVMERLAGGVSEASARIAAADLQQAFDDAGAYARRNPMLFLGGAALLGFAGARFLKASAPQDDPAETQVIALPKPKKSNAAARKKPARRAAAGGRGA